MNGIETREIRTYFKQLAQQHRRIAHTDRKKGFFGYDVDEFTETPNKAVLSEFPLILADIKPRFFKNSGDLRSQMSISFIVLHQPKADLRDFESQYESFDLAYVVGVEICARIINDSTNGTCPRSFQHIKGDEFTATMVGPYATRHVGWRFNFPIKSVNTIEFNESAWQLP